METKHNRREFLGAVATVGAVIGAASVLRSEAAWATDAAASGDKVIAELGKVKDLNQKVPTFVKAEFKDGDGNVVLADKLYVRWDKTNDTTGHWVILSAICTHLKCKLNLSDDKSKFECPCHHSEFSLDGKVLKKPAKKDLPEYSDQAFEEDGVLKLRRDAPPKPAS
jgi:Rieske Fe-S protein